MEKFVFTSTIVLPGTAVVMPIAVGFTPSSVKIDAYSSPTVVAGKLTAGTYVGTLEWVDTMADASGQKTIAAGTVSAVFTNGVSLPASTDNIKGFKVGIETTINVATYAWVIKAIRN
jgi:hypothetical protein